MSWEGVYRFKTDQGGLCLPRLRRIPVFFRGVNRINYNYYDHHSFSVMLCKSPSALKRNKRSRVTKGRYNVRYWEVIRVIWALRKYARIIHLYETPCSRRDTKKGNRGKWRQGNETNSFRIRSILRALFLIDSLWRYMRECRRGREANVSRATCICETMVYLRSDRIGPYSRDVDENER